MHSNCWLTLSLIPSRHQETFSRLAVAASVQAEIDNPAVNRPDTRGSLLWLVTHCHLVIFRNAAVLFGAALALNYQDWPATGLHIHSLASKPSDKQQDGSLEQARRQLLNHDTDICKCKLMATRVAQSTTARSSPSGSSTRLTLQLHNIRFRFLSMASFVQPRHLSGFSSYANFPVYAEDFGQPAAASYDLPFQGNKSAHIIFLIPIIYPGAISSTTPRWSNSLAMQMLW